jgi:hypothetical protein
VGRKPSSNLMSRRTETPYKADGTGKLAQHSQTRCSVPEVNGAVAQGKFTSLLRETWVCSTVATPGTPIREARRADPGVSGGHSTGSHEPGNTPEGLTSREGLNLAGSTTTTGRWRARKPTSRAKPRASVAESESADSPYGTARNRRTRTRMSGGVGGGRSILPPTRLARIFLFLNRNCPRLGV